MRWWLLGLIVGSAGCNEVFGLTATQSLDADMRPDLDKDGIADVDDPCIISPEDEMSDVDMDGVALADDGCPFNRDSRDDDGDGVPSICDPFPSLPGDRHRCSMAFNSIELNAALWAPRPTENPAAIASGFLIGFGDASAIAVEPVLPTDAPTLTIDAVLSTFSVDQPYEIGLWLSAGPTPSSSDVACRVIGTGATTTPIIAITGPNPATSAPGPAATSGSFYMRVILQPTRAGTNFVCVASYDMVGNYVVTRSHIDPPLGDFGFMSLSAPNVISGLVVYERDTMPPLP